jgi:AhpD family alkylhydroperoxidase
MKEVQPDAYKAMAVLGQYVSNTSIEPIHRELIKIRASQINGCAYCISMHTKDARKLGEMEQRIYLLSAWRESGDIFTEKEKAILELTEEVTLISQHGISDAVYDKAIDVLGEQQTAEVIMSAITINAWNRIGVGLNMHPQLEKV